MTDPAREHLEFQECLDHQEQTESQVQKEREAKLDYQETWDLLVSQVLKAHLVYLVSKVSVGHLDSQE